MTFFRMTPPSLLLAVPVAVLKRLRPANSLEKAVDDFNSLHETTSSTGLATASRCPLTFNFSPTLSSKFYKGKYSSPPSTWRHRPPSLYLLLFCRRRCRCRRHYHVFYVPLIRVSLTTPRENELRAI